MSVVVTLFNRLGNNLFQYALGRLIAEHHGFELRCEYRPLEPPTFVGQPLNYGPAASLPELAAHFPNAPLNIPGRQVDEPVESYEMAPGHPWQGQTIDLDSILADRTPRQIRLSGFFQRFEYFAPYQERIRQWFRLEGVPAVPVLGADDVVLNIRRGFDYGINDWTLALDYYAGVLDSLPDPGRVYVCGTCIDEPVRRALEPYAPTYVHGSPIEHFALMTRARRIVLSNSTFAWWAAFLSEATAIYAPRAPHDRAYGFTGFQDVDLHMRAPRYLEVTKTTLAPFAPISVIAGSLPDERVDPASRELFTWMLQHDQPVALGTLSRRYPAAELIRMITTLARARLVVAEARYIERMDTDGAAARVHRPEVP